MIRVVVYGRAAPQGSKRHVGKGVMVESSRHVKPWREDVRGACLEWIQRYTTIMQEAGGGIVRVAPQNDGLVWALPLDYPLRVSMTFTVPKPASAPKKRTTFPDRMPDLSKLVRSTEDAITSAGLWRDDARVVELTTAKRYPNEGLNALDRPGCVITIEVIG